MPKKSTQQPRPPEAQVARTTMSHERLVELLMLFGVWIYQDKGERRFAIDLGAFGVGMKIAKSEIEQLRNAIKVHATKVS